MTELVVTQYFTYWRAIEIGGSRVVEGLVAREHAAPSRALARRIAEWDGYHYWQSSPEGRWLVLVQEHERARERWWLHALLFLLTLITASLGGAALAGITGVWYHPTLAEVRAGLPFSLPLLAILLAHESGHYVAARHYRVDASPPYFIPFPAQWNILGTMGAFIRLRSAVFDRRTLFDIGVAGPLAGIAIALPVLIVGLALSAVEPSGPVLPLSHQYLAAAPGGEGIFIGDSLLLMACRALLGIHGAVRLHPMAMAGWVGLLVTMLNLLPLTQLDGGHIAYSMFGRAQPWIARIFWICLIPLGFFWWPGWWLWAVLGLLLGRGRLTHPSVIAPEHELGPGRRVLGWLTIALFFVTFMPRPWSF